MKTLHARYGRQIKSLINRTRKLIRDCSLENGAIVAADPTQRDYPACAQNYFYVWPRDAAFACLAADMLGIDHIQQKFFRWCLERAEGFKDRGNGLFYEKYHPNGLKALAHFQPDQTGLVLLALWHHYKNHAEGAQEFHALIEQAADGICRVWHRDHFTVVTQDVWEERLCFPDLHENFSYSLAACIKGLKCAHAMIPNQKWLKTAGAMRRRLDRHFAGHFARSCGDIPDVRIDASILGLVYPFDVYEAKDERMVSSVGEIEKKLVFNGGVHRYEQDDYDGWMYETEHRKKGAGAWPLLNFWMSIYFSGKGDDVRAAEYYTWVLEKMKRRDGIPEQIFENDQQVSVSPLLWSHAMFILATGFLNPVPRASTERLMPSKSRGM